MMRRGAHGESGFTLLEVTIAMALLASMMTITFYAFSNVFMVTKYSERSADVVRTGRQVMSRVTRELSNAYITQVNTNITGGLAPASTTKWAFKAKDQTMNFTMVGHTKFYKDVNESDEAELGYYLEEDPKSEKNTDGKYRLMRRIDVTPDDDPERGGIARPVAHNVKAFSFKFFNPKKDDWYGDWDTENAETINQLPYAVRVEVTLVDQDNIEHPFVTQTIVKMAKPLEPR